MNKQPVIDRKVRFSFTIPILDDIRREGVGIVRFNTVIGTELRSNLEVVESNHYKPGERIYVYVRNLSEV